MLERYPKDVKLVYKNFPLRNHAMARPAAVAAMAAGEQGRFWEFHDKLFENFNQLSEERIQQIAEELGLDLARYEEDKKDPEIARIINRDMQEAVRIGVRGTPTIFVNGRQVKNRSLQGFQQLIEKALAKKAEARR